MTMSEHVRGIYRDIATERQRQQDKWGTQRHDTIPAAAFPVWVVILSEEVGELSERVLQYRQYQINSVESIRNPSDLTQALDTINRRESRLALQRMRDEAIQCAAVAVSMIEHIDEELEASHA
jgi:hypothetical protein